MIQSMTGYGRDQKSIDGINITIELKSVNSRYFEFNCRLPKGYLFLENKLKEFTQSKISRGKVEMYVSIESEGQNDIEISVNEAYAQSYISALKSLAKKLKIKNDVSTSNFVNNSDIFKISRKEINEDDVTASALSVADTAIQKFISMREVEGDKLRDDVVSRTNEILKMVEFVETQSPKTVEAYRQKLENKIKDLLDNSQFDESRIITETAIYADKVAVSEETVRLRSHIAQFVKLVNEGGAIGRKLDFIVQEMNRETNTIGSKAQDIEIAQVVVNIKSEIEKIREQIQNIE